MANLPSAAAAKAMYHFVPPARNTAKSTTSSGSTSTSAKTTTSTPSTSSLYTVTNPKTGQSISFSNVNNLTPAQRIEIAAAYKAGGVSVKGSGGTSTSDGGATATSGSSGGSSQYTAPNGKKYTITVDPNTGRASFVGYGGQTKSFASFQAARSNINANNPGQAGSGTSVTLKNTTPVAADKISQNIINTDSIGKIASGISAQLQTLSPEVRQQQLNSIISQKVSEAQKNGEIVAGKASATAYAKNLYEKYASDPSVVGSKKSATDNSNIAEENRQTYEYTAPNGKQYTLTKNTATGQVEFTNKAGDQEVYDNFNAAVSKINNNNVYVEGAASPERNQPKSGTTFGLDTAVVGEDGSVDTGNEFGDAMTDIAEKNKDANQQLEDAADAEKRARLEALINETNTINENQKAILNNRMSAIQSSFSTINSYIANLQATASNLFDKKTQRAADARAKQLADKGYLMDDQAAAVSEYSLADYKANAELQKSEIDKEIQSKLIEIEQEKAKMINSVLQDASTNEANKQTQINYINQLYNTMVSDYQTKSQNINDTYATTVNSVLNQPYSQEVNANALQKQTEATTAAEQELIQKSYKNDAIRTKVIQGRVSTEYAPYVSEVVGELKSQYGVQWYIGKDIDEMTKYVSEKARQKYFADQRSATAATKYFANQKSATAAKK